MAVIFDLDQTLLDTSSAEAHRKAGNWSLVYTLIPTFSIFPGMEECLNFLHQKRVPIAIVTSSPRAYCTRVVNHFKLPIFHSVCYHDTVRKKPHADPIYRALELINIESSKAITIGDSPNDILAAKNAGTMAIGAQWGISNKEILKSYAPDYLMEDCSELLSFLEKTYS